jgi:hypothetical protein
MRDATIKLTCDAAWNREPQNVDVQVATVEYSLGASRLIWLLSVYKRWHSPGLTLPHNTNSHVPSSGLPLSVATQKWVFS